MKNHQLVQICWLGVSLASIVGCANRNSFPPQQFQQAFPYNYAGQPGGQPIQPGPMVGQPPMGQQFMGQPPMGQQFMGQPPMGQQFMGQPPMGQPGFPPQQFQGQPQFYGPAPGQTGRPLIGS